jgi:anthranilate synthase / indole-3-glycerol phosphate synthase / phosphoribosylanthranilate isomerase
MTTLLIDNYDSFTYNVYQYLCELGATVKVVRNDAITVADVAKLAPVNIVISPGPGHPRDAGISNDVIKEFSGKVPILGVCLGHQCIVETFGGKVDVSCEIVHGKTSKIDHDSKGIYDSVPEFEATRYHSLAAVASSMPECLHVTATCAAKTVANHTIIQGVRHKTHTVIGMQYHPESISTTHGKCILENFLKIKGGSW